MYKLVTLEDTVRVEPKYLHLPLHESVHSGLNAKYANRVIEALRGLGVLVFDILSLREPYIHPGEGAVFVAARFRLILFAPFLGQVLEGAVRKMTSDGVYVSIGFFEDICLPAASLQPGSYFSARDQAWVWKYDDDTELPMEVDEKIRFRVLEVAVRDVHPKEFKKRVKAESTASEQPSTHDAETEGDPHEVASAKAPMIITGAANEDGLGMVSWWNE